MSTRGVAALGMTQAKCGPADFPVEAIERRMQLVYEEGQAALRP